MVFPKKQFLIALGILAFGIFAFAAIMLGPEVFDYADAQEVGIPGFGFCGSTVPISVSSQCSGSAPRNIVSWSTTESAQGGTTFNYEVKRSLGAPGWSWSIVGSGQYTAVPTPATFSFTDTSVQAGTIYYYDVQLTVGGSCFVFTQSVQSVLTTSSCAAATGNIFVYTRIDDNIQSSDNCTQSVNFSYSGPASGSDTCTARWYASMPVGTYTFSYGSGGPTGTIFTRIAYDTQTLFGGGNMNVYFDFTRVGTIKAKRVDQNNNLFSRTTFAEIDGPFGTTGTANPLAAMNQVVGISHSVVSDALSGFSAQIGTCSVIDNTNGDCTPSNFLPTNAFGLTVPANSIPAGGTFVVVFKYIPIQTLPGPFSITSVQSFCPAPPDNVISWSGSANATSYDVYWCQGSGCSPSSFLTTTTGTSATHADVSPGVIYRYQVAANNAVGTTWSSNIGEVQGNTTCTPSVNGVCGPANNVPSPTPPSSGLCSPGTPTTVSDQVISWGWACGGSGSGGTAICSAPKTVCTPGTPGPSQSCTTADGCAGTQAYVCNDAGSAFDKPTGGCVKNDPSCPATGDAAICDGGFHQTPMGGATLSQPVAKFIPSGNNSQYQNTIGVVVRGMDQGVYHTNYSFSTNRWSSGWTFLNGHTRLAPYTYVGGAWDIIVKDARTSDPDQCDNNWRTISSASGRQNVLIYVPSGANSQFQNSIVGIARGSDGNLYFNKYSFVSHSWEGWNPLSAAGRYIYARMEGGVLKIWVWGMDGNLYRRENTLSGWGGWIPEGRAATFGDPWGTSNSTVDSEGRSWDFRPTDLSEEPFRPLDYKCAPSVSENNWHNINWSSGWTGWSKEGTGSWPWGTPTTVTDAPRDNPWSVMRGADIGRSPADGIFYACGAPLLCPLPPDWINPNGVTVTVTSDPAFITLSWAGTSHTASYGVRLVDNINSSERYHNPSWTSSICGGSLGASLHYVCENGIPSSQTSLTGVQVHPGKTYTFWVDALPSNAACAVVNKAGSFTVVAAPPTADIKANGSDSPPAIPFNTSATLTWTSSNATSCIVTPGGWTGISNLGQSTGNLISPRTYVLFCSGVGGSAFDSVTVNVDAAPQPDLITNHQDITITGALTTGNILTFASTVRNQGSGSAIAGSVGRWCIDNSNCLNSTTGRINVHTFGTFDPGMTSSLRTSNGWSATVGAHTIWWCADVTNVITNESNETNNCHFKDFTVVAGGCVVNTPISWEDPILTPNATLIRAKHFDDMRTWTNSRRAGVLLDPFIWENPTLIANETPIRKLHIEQLRTAISAVYAACSKPAPVWTSITENITTIRAAHIDQLRAAISDAMRK